MRFGETRRIAANFTRPANATAYAAGDVVGDGTVITFKECVFEEGRGGVIHSALLIDEASESTKLDSELFLFRANPGNTADNAAFDPTDAEVRELVGVIDFGATPFVALASGNAVFTVNSVGIAFTCGATLKDLYGVLVARNAYVPISEEKFNIVLNILMD